MEILPLAWMPHNHKKSSWSDWDGLVGGLRHLSQVPIQDKTLCPSKKTLSTPGLLSKPTPGCKDASISSCPVTADPPFHCDIARIWSPPETEQVRLCRLASVQNGWLPVQRRAVVYSIPCQRPDPEMIPCQGQQHQQKHSSRNREIRHTDEQNLAQKKTNLMGFKTLTSPAEDSSRISQAPGKENTTSQKSNLPPSQAGPCKEWEEVPRFFPLLSGGMQLDDPGKKSCVLLSAQSPPWSPNGNAQSAQLVPAGTEAKMSFLYITITSRRIPQGPDAAPLVCSDLNTMTLPGREQPDPTLISPVATRGHTQSNCNGQPPVGKEKAAIMKMKDYRLCFCSSQRVSGTRLTEIRHSFSKMEEKNTPIGSSRSSVWSPFHSCVHLKVPSSHIKSILFLTKSLFVSLREDGLDVETTKSVIYRSTLSLQLQSNSIKTTYKPTPHDPLQLRRPVSKTSKNPLSCCGVPGDMALDLGITTPPSSVQWRSRLHVRICNTEPKFSAHALSAGWPPGNSNESPPQNAKQVGIANEDTCLCWTRTRGLQATIGTTEVVDAGSFRRTTCMEAGAKHGPCGVENVGCVSRSWSPVVTESNQPQSRVRLENTTLDGLTLREALELFRPEFISRSQDRVKQLEQRTQERRTGQSRGPASEARRGRRRRNCTKPLPLSDNLYKPKERAISGKEMQRRSKRIYNSLPEVTKKKEEEKKKAASHTNRLRAELFKKKLLNQVLQRNSD
ncbi:uncharacterized protein LOC108932714 [Scleropages formosus]|uniref:ALMS motif domain-containing protein n=1 Tax=Scleropages formosus TaxID=113540 RepID=A0A8C9RFY3_SCLFO|nr:(E2-independent) E3 ubiquitin-conjugating enzyme FATS [Scleropages formosus]